MFETTKITFLNRNDFELAVGSILGSLNVRSNSAGSLDIGYADKIFCFSDKCHAIRAIEEMEKLNFEKDKDFTVDFN